MMIKGMYAYNVILILNTEATLLEGGHMKWEIRAPTALQVYHCVSTMFAVSTVHT